MRKIFAKIRTVMRNLYNRIKPIFVKGSKAIWKVVKKAILLLAMFAFFVIPFLNLWLDNFIAQCIWYPAFVVMIILAIQDHFKKEDLDDEKNVVTHIEKWTEFPILFVFLSIFVIRYYRITYIWLWVIFGVVAIYTFFFFLSLFSYEFKHRELTEDEKQKISINAVKCIILYWLFDLTYMGIFNGWVSVIIICGILAVTIVFYNLAHALLNISESLRIWLVFEFLFGIGISIYVIYIIPNETLQNIIVAIVAAVFGGFFTLIGVAWTFKKGDMDRKEDERKKNIPYMKVVHGIKKSSEVCAHIYKGLDLSNAKDVEKVGENSLYLITIQDCIMKNISESNIILQGMLFDDNRYDFTDPVILEKGEVCKIRITDNHSIVVPNLENTLNLIVNDTMDNVYSIECKLNYESQNRIITTTIEECEYVGFEFKCVVGSVKLPELVDVRR